jgi:hypothetical protein
MLAHVWSVQRILKDNKILASTFACGSLAGVVLWQVIDGPEEWLGTKVSFDLKQNGDWTIVLFKHQGWKEPVEFMHHCSTKWGVFLLSLKSLLETGKGAAWPHEIKLDSWK